MAGPDDSVERAVAGSMVLEAVEEAQQNHADVTPVAFVRVIAIRIEGPD